jgi:hypothetical protein
MLVRVFSTGRSSGKAPVNYLLSQTDHTGQPRSVVPEVVHGHPETTIQIIDGITRKHKYVSGVIAFRDEEKPTRQQMYQVIDCFNATLAPGLSADQFNSLWVLHQDKGNTELHFVYPMTLTNGKRWNIHPPGQKNIALYDEFTRVMNHSLGFRQVTRDPFKLSVADFELKRGIGPQRKKQLKALGLEIEAAVKAGKVTARSELVVFMEEELGMTITRQGQQYLSVKFPGSAQVMRLKGPMFDSRANYGDLLSGDATTRLSQSAYELAVDRMMALVQERHTFNTKLCRPSVGMFSRNGSMRPSARASNSEAPRATTTSTTSTGGTMKNDINRVRTLIQEVLALAKLICAEEPSVKVKRTTQQVVTRIKQQRESGGSGGETSMSSAMDSINALQLAIGSLQTSIDAVNAEVANAKDPQVRAKAVEKLQKLMEQMRRLSEELGAAKRRQINEAPSKRMRI